MKRYDKPYLLKTDATSKTRGVRSFNDNRSVYKNIKDAIKQAESLTQNNGENEYWVRHRVWIIDRNANESECVVFDWKRDE